MKENTKEAINLPVKKDEFSQKRRVGWVVTGVIILVIEIYIAIFIKGGFIRHYIGDVLATAMLYAFGRAIFRVAPINLAIFVFVISLFIEAAQYLKILEILDVKSSTLRIIFGGTFDWADIIYYLVGCILAYMFENLSMQKSKAH
ncbi:ribosomal maturation YjgA family protein [Campylobacter concisus]